VKNCVGEIASLKAMSRLGLVDSSTAGVSECAVALNVIVATAGGAAAGALAGGSQGALAGAGASSNNERFNRQLHEPEKTKAQQIAATAKAQGLTNADGSPITAAQIENAMRGASNSQYGETITTGMVVPLNASTPANAVYDTAGMKVQNDGAGNNYLVQDPVMLNTPSTTVMNLIQQSTGGANSPYSWSAPSTPGTPMPTIDATGPFSPAPNGCITGDCAAGLPASRQTAPPSVTYTAGIGGTVVVGYGGSTGVGVYFTPGFGNTTFDAGIYGTCGTGYGFDPSIDAAVGFNKGNVSDLRGVASNVNIAVALADLGIGGSVTYSNGQATGASYGIGIKGVPSVAGGTASVTNMTTCTFGISNIKSGMAQAICK